MYYRTIRSLIFHPFTFFLLCFADPIGSACFDNQSLPNDFLCPTQREARNRNTAVNKLASTFHLKADAGHLALRQETFGASTNLIGRQCGAMRVRRTSRGDFGVL